MNEGNGKKKLGEEARKKRPQLGKIDENYNNTPKSLQPKNNENRGALITFTGCELSHSNYQTDSLWATKLYWKNCLLKVTVWQYK